MDSDFAFELLDFKNPYINLTNKNATQQKRTNVLVYININKICHEYIFVSPDFILCNISHQLSKTVLLMKYTINGCNSTSSQETMIAIECAL